jgi:hypothetical protein
MPGNEFEIQVREKMAGLQLSPSPGVWENVEQRIRHKKRRRFVYLPLIFLSLLLAGYGIYYFSSSDKGTKAPQVAGVPSIQQTTPANPPVAVGTSADKRNTAITPVAIDPASPAGKQQINAGNNAPPSGILSNSTPAFTTRVTGKPLRDTPKEGDRNRADRNVADAATRIADPVKGKDDPSASNPAITDNRLAPADAIPYNLEPALRNNILPSAFSMAKKVPPAVIPLQNASVPLKQSTQQRKWEWGVTASVGFSNVGDDPFSSLNTASKSTNQSNMNASPGLPLAGNGPQPFVPYNYTPGEDNGNSAFVQLTNSKTSLAWAVGFYIRRQVSKNNSVSLGLNFAQYNTSAGKFTRIADQRNIQQYSGIPIHVSSYHLSTDSNGTAKQYFNTYRYLEVPLGFQSDFLKRNTVTLSWNMGVTGGLLLGSNALHYSTASRVFFTNKKLLADVQLGLSAGLSIRIASPGKMPFSISPQFRYNANSILAAPGKLAPKLLFGGVRVELPLGRK